MHATILHLLGIDHEQLTWLHNGRRFRLTDVAGKVLLADPGPTATDLPSRSRSRSDCAEGPEEIPPPRDD